MSVFKTIVLAAVAIGIAGGASAAESRFAAPNSVKAIVSGEIFRIYNGIADREARQLLRTYLIGFGSGMHAECSVLPRSMEENLLRYVRTVMQDGDRPAHALKAGYEDARMLTGEFGCGSDVGRAAARTVQRYMK
jgi:hypothetical protein